jgi:hypothetical protein
MPGQIIAWAAWRAWIIAGVPGLIFGFFIPVLSVLYLTLLTLRWNAVVTKKQLASTTADRIWWYISGSP